MEDAVLVHVINGFKNLVHQELNSVFGEVIPPTLNRFIHIHIHELEHQCQSASWLVTIVLSLTKLCLTIKPHEV
jgi:hypothetical protein